MNRYQGDLRQYLMPPVWTFWLAAAFVLPVSVMVFAVSDAVGASLFLVALMAFFAYLAVKDNIKAWQRVREYEARGALAGAEADFSAGKEALGGQLRMGELNLYGKQMGLILPYGEIARIYQYVHKTNFVEDRRMLIALTHGGERYSLCKLEKRGKSDHELALVLAAAKARNPGIQFGYDRR